MTGGNKNDDLYLMGGSHWKSTEVKATISVDMHKSHEGIWEYAAFRGGIVGSHHKTVANELKYMNMSRGDTKWKIVTGTV